MQQWSAQADSDTSLGYAALDEADSERTSARYLVEAAGVQQQSCWILQCQLLFLTANSHFKAHDDFQIPHYTLLAVQSCCIPLQAKAAAYSGVVCLWASLQSASLYIFAYQSLHTEVKTACPHRRRSVRGAWTLCPRSLLSTQKLLK